MDSGVTQVLQRIQAIEERFSPKAQKDTGEFQTLMNAELRALKPKSSQTGSSGAAINRGNPAGAPDDIMGMIARSAHKYGVDPKLVDAVAKTESNYAADAVSSAGAVGVMQLMPETAASLGVNNIYDPRDNIEGGTKYLKQLLTTFNGDVTKTVAAYNAGPQAVKNYNGVPPYDETQNYVKKVFDLYR